ncbi:ATP-binding cassette domain-containing protein [Jannaschia seohaensis]|uniref:Thiamine transport system ATP-binding protein n=1 Tax=Jannaschia seohaensis TaxID=475081 RepID=A0A2Y9A104_9RHOB|nr:ATP-binding cassette domain-containing protein [Jannaschia seohaensis]PWJ21687.1 thiamine transport system ATP-binding protein [Jannaschia seohaensis]SSA37965.1 thiamine transport system ATP-binding protein [Jannaschia seohaensis]
MLELDGLEIVQGAFRLTADTVLQAGQITALMGASGSGKSTLLAAIAGFLDPVRGSIRIAGTDITGLAPGDRPLSMLFQDNNLFPHLTVAQNVGLGLRPDLRLSPAQKDAQAAVLARVGLEGLEARRPRDLSGGQQSRAALARALLRGRPWLLLDEPFSALGPALRRDMLTLLRETARAEGLSVLMVTHHPEDARAVADATCLIADGALIPPASTEALFAEPTPALRAYLGE